MKKSLTINATRAGKKVAKNIGFVNPNVANSLVGSAAQMFNALTNDTFVNSEVVKVMDTSEEESPSTPTPAPAGKTEGIIEFDRATGKISYNGDADYVCVFMQTDQTSFDWDAIAPAQLSTYTVQVDEYLDYYFLATATENYTAAAFFSEHTGD